MSNTKFPAELDAFFSHYIAEVDGSDPEADPQAARNFAATGNSERLSLVVSQLERLEQSGDVSLELLGSQANRWFGDVQEAKSWILQLLSVLKEGLGSASGLVVKDSNGAPLAEGDTVQVIKDLKVKGGSSDLKRGTVIKKIHLIDDTDNVECRVDGSTLVLKTCFLKKA